MRRGVRVHGRALYVAFPRRCVGFETARVSLRGVGGRGYSEGHGACPSADDKSEHAVPIAQEVASEYEGKAS